jgi:MFS family permease
VAASSSPFTALRHPLYRRVWAATVIDQTGNWLQITGRAYLIYHVTGSTTSLGTIYFLSYIPQLLLSQVGGVVADRFDRRRVLMAGGALMGLGAAAMALLAVTDTANVATVGAVSVVLGAVATLSQPAELALVPALVPREDLTSAMSLTGATQATTRVIGPLLAGALIPVVGVAWLFWLNTASYAAVLGVWALTRVAPNPVMVERSTFKAIAASARWVWDTPAVRVLVLTTLVVAGIGQVYQPLAVAFCTKVLAHGNDDLGASYYGLFQAAIGVGSAIGILSLATLANRQPRRALVISALGCAASLFSLGFVHSLALALVAAVGIGVFQFALTTLALTLIQYMSPEDMRGRVVSIHSVAFVGPLPLIGLAGGALASVIGLPATLLGFGAFCLLYCVPFLRMAHHLPATSLGEPDVVTALAAQEEEDSMIVGEELASLRDASPGEEVPGGASPDGAPADDPARLDPTP